MGSYFPLIDQAVTVLDIEFDRILDRDDVFLEVLIYVLYHRSECGRFSASGRSCHEYQPFSPMQELPHLLGDTEALKARYIDRDIPYCDGEPSGIIIDIHPEFRFVESV